MDEALGRDDPVREPRGRRGQGPVLNSARDCCLATVGRRTSRSSPSGSCLCGRRRCLLARVDGEEPATRRHRAGGRVDGGGRRDDSARAPTHWLILQVAFAGLGRLPGGPVGLIGLPMRSKSQRTRSLHGHRDVDDDAGAGDDERWSFARPRPVLGGDILALIPGDFGLGVRWRGPPQGSRQRPHAASSSRAAVWKSKFTRVDGRRVFTGELGTSWLRTRGLHRKGAPYRPFATSSSPAPVVAQAARPSRSVARPLIDYWLVGDRARRALSRCSSRWTSRLRAGRIEGRRRLAFVMKNKSLCLVSLQAP